MPIELQIKVEKNDNNKELNKQEIDDIKTINDFFDKNKTSDDKIKEGMETGELANIPENITKAYKNLKDNSENRINFLESYSKEDYEDIKNKIINVIKTNGFNKEYESDNKEFLNTLLISSNKYTVEGYLAYYNLQIIKNNISKKGNIQDNLVDIDKFMIRFENESIKTNDISDEESLNVEPFKSDKEDQKVGEFIELSQDRKNLITNNMNNIINKKEKINFLNLFGWADGTHITLEGMKQVQKNYKYNLEKLIKAGIKGLPNINLLQAINESNFEKTENQKQLNDAYAYTRAMMQISFLPNNYLNYIKNNADNVEFKIDAKDISGREKGDEYTGGKITIEMPGAELSETTLIKEKLLKMINIIKINFVIENKKTKKYSVIGLIGIENKNGTLNVGNINFNNKVNEINSRSHDLPKDKKGSVFFDENALNLPPNWDTINIVIGTNENRNYNQTNQNNSLVPNFSNDIDGFKKALSYLGEKSDATQKNYVNNVIRLLDAYKNIENELNNEKKNKVISF
ncbi:MAG: hypothetical protein WC872_04140 [Candidatus Absconditabacterales bacterium]